MTWMDEMPADLESRSYKATYDLLLWLKTVAPITGIQSINICNTLVDMAKELDWPIEEDEQIGTMLKSPYANS